MILSKITFMKGNIALIRENKQIKPEINMRLLPEDVIITEENSKANIIILDFGVCSIKENTRIEVAKLTKKAERMTTELTMPIGKVIIGLKKLSKEKDFSINTPTAVVGVRGTIFMVTAEQSEKDKPVAIKIAVLSGKVELGNAENPEEKVLVEELTEAYLPGPDFAKLELIKMNRNTFDQIKQIAELNEIKDYKLENVKQEIIEMKSKMIEKEKPVKKVIKKKEVKEKTEEW